MKLLDKLKSCLSDVNPKDVIKDAVPVVNVSVTDVFEEAFVSSWVKEAKSKLAKESLHLVASGEKLEQTLSAISEFGFCFPDICAVVSKYPKARVFSRSYKGCNIGFRDEAELLGLLLKEEAKRIFKGAEESSQ